MIGKNATLRLATTMMLMAGLVGCWGPSDPFYNNDDLTPKWRQLNDDSRFATIGSTGSDVVAIRCWPDGGGYRCLEAGRSKSAQSVTVTSTWSEVLPPVVIPVLHAFEGYSCGKSETLYEQISRDGYTLTLNDLGFGGAPWTGEYVRTIMAKHDMEDRVHFGCFDVLSAVETGGLFSLSTAAVTKGMAR